ncbi:DNA polymerase III subunit delta' [Palleronia sediminis]|uniref:DNA polymerase III subunit delta n=1 Tax=Palleronia sediminis TaxID=2547833 RepID=A0A4R6ADJ9_9RHOB|nr:DNA polymerase III subunit delta' [Palleronia sediminis]TDL81277.1 DNA polymerase III subunit delta' [Palleronia sediminis]
MSDDDEYQPDRVEGVPHPRMTETLIGHDAAEAEVAQAMARGRMHHAWLISGPRGVGKATLAWAIARYVVAYRPDAAPPDHASDSLALPPDHPVIARSRALSEPRLFLMRPTRNPDTGTPRRQITVDVARKLKDFLSLSAADGGWRAVIVDAADDMTVQAANAILKLLEEPPARTVFLLVCHAPSRLLPTIRSRCRRLDCGPLDADDLARALAQAGLAPGDDAAALAELSQGSVGEAARLLQEDGPALYAALTGLFADTPRLDRAGLVALAGRMGGAAGQGRMDVFCRVVVLFLARLARMGAGLPPAAPAAPDEMALLARLSPGPAAARAWAALEQEVSARLSHGRAVNLDPSQLVLDTGVRINETGRAVLGR